MPILQAELIRIGGGDHRRFPGFGAGGPGIDAQALRGFGHGQVFTRLGTGVEGGDEAAYGRFITTLNARAETGEDLSVAEAAQSLRIDPWTASAEAWEAPVIAAADADQLSLQDWHRNALHGTTILAPCPP